MSKTTSTEPWVDPDDAPRLTSDWFSGAELKEGDKVLRRGRPRIANPKKPVSLRLDQDLIEWFKASGDGWQTRINNELRKVAGI